MISAALLYLVAVLCSARWTQAVPLYSDAGLEPQAGQHLLEVPRTKKLIQKLVTEVEDGANTGEMDQRERSDLYPLLMQHTSERDPWTKGAKEEKYDNMVDDLKEVILKMAAADKLRSQGFVRSVQSLPKTSKRACFWKYCVTN